MESPDKNSSGFLTEKPDSLRYDFASVDPDDVGMKIAGMIIPQSRVLDVGCGTGVISEMIKLHTQADIMGVEPDAERVKKARERNLTVYEGLLDENFFNEHGTFDYIIFSDVLEHLENPAEIVRIAKKGLNSSGAIIVSVPNIAHWFVRTDLLFGNFNYQDCGIMDATHLRWFTRDTIKSFFKNTGFEIAAFDYTINISLADFRRRLPWRWMKTSFSKRIVKQLASISPGLFGCQFVVKAVLPHAK